MTNSITRLLILVAVSATIAGAQAPAAIPVRVVTGPDATSELAFVQINGVRALQDGRVLVNDGAARRLVLLDRGLRAVRTVADTLGATPLAYGSRASVLMPYPGDSTLFADLGGRALLLLDANGAVARVMAAPRANDVAALAVPSAGAPGLDAQGRLVYRTSLMPQFRAPVVGKPYTPPTVADSAPLLRADFETRSVDTVAWLRTGKIRVKTVMLPNGGVRLTPMVTPISTIDDWTLLADGTIALLRGRDYHIDWIAADGRQSASAKLPFDWKALSDSAKEAMLDSTQALIRAQAVRDSIAAVTQSSMASRGAAAAGGHGGGFAGSASGHGMTIMPVGSPDGLATPQSAGRGPEGPEIADVVPASDLPDYYPPISRSGLLRADPAGRVWILPATSALAGTGLLYDVVSRDGATVERVRLPEGRTLEAVLPDGALLLIAHDSTGNRLERVRVHRP